MIKMNVLEAKTHLFVKGFIILQKLKLAKRLSDFTQP